MSAQEHLVEATDKVHSDETALIAEGQSLNSAATESNEEASTRTSVPTQDAETGDPEKITNVAPTSFSRGVSDAQESGDPFMGSADAQTESSDSGSTATGSAERNPRNIRGRRSSHSKRTTNPHANTVVPFTPRPDLICRPRLGSWQWEIILSARECSIAEVRHNENPLPAENGEYQLPGYYGYLSVKYADGTVDKLSLFDGKPLIFKLRNNWKGDGHKIGGITRGHFIVFAPNEWTRTGNVPVAPKGCLDTSFQAHYFSTTQGHDTDMVGSFKECQVPLTKAGFSLSGTNAFDNSDDGELFVGSPPIINPAPGIFWARVGEEQEGGWTGENFKPADLPLGDVLNGRQGRFYLRVYNDKVKLMDSSDFRYCADLQEIRVNGKRYVQDMQIVPSSDGHESTTLQFVDTDGATIHAVPTEDNPQAILGADGVVTVAPISDGDETTWSLDSGAGSTDVVIRLPRIWWRMVHPGVSPGSWCDRPLRMSRDEFREQRQANVEIQLPFCIGGVRAGFNEDLNQSHAAHDGGDNTRHVSFSLGDFVDYEEIDRPSSEDVYLQIECGQDVLDLICVTADSRSSLPELDVTTYEPKSQPGNRPDTLACSMNGRPTSGNKGFSRRELDGANFTIGNARCLLLRVDKRRRSMHGVNVKTLKEIKDHA